jgi:hypothetical protein
MRKRRVAVLFWLVLPPSLRFVLSRGWVSLSFGFRFVQQTGDFSLLFWRYQLFSLPLLGQIT